MYILKSFKIPNGDTIVNISPFDKDDTYLTEKDYSPDLVVSISIGMKIDEYRTYIHKEFNLKLYYYRSARFNRMIYFTCAETLEQANRWKDWVESYILINKLTRGEDQCTY